MPKFLPPKVHCNFVHLFLSLPFSSLHMPSFINEKVTRSGVSLLYLCTKNSLWICGPLHDRRWDGWGR
jgi:hypothetical protein